MCQAEEGRLSSSFSWKCSKLKEILKINWLTQAWERYGDGFRSTPLPVPLAVWEWLHPIASLAAAHAYASSYLNAAYNPALMIFKRILLINCLNLLMVCLYPFVLLSALCLWFNSSFASPLLCPNLLICNNCLFFLRLLFCLARKS